MAFGADSQTLNSTTNKYIKKRVMAISRKRVLFGAITSRGRVTNGMSGDLVNQKVRYKRLPMQTFTDGDTLTFVRTNKHKTAKWGMRMYTVQESITEPIKLMNKGKEAVFSLWQNAINDATDDIKDQFCERLIQIDGYATGYTDQVLGLESMFGASNNASSLFGTNSDTYGELSTTRGNYGGTWTGTWPDQNAGTCDPHFDFWSPLVVNYTSTLAASSGGWTSATKTWDNTCVQAVSQAIINTQRNGDDLDFLLLAKGLYFKLLERARESERLMVTRNQDSGMTKLGFKGINIDGVDIFWEPAVPTGVGYGLCMDQLELMSWQDQLFKSATDFNLESLSDRVVIKFAGNLRAMSPRCFCKLAALA